MKQYRHLDELRTMYDVKRTAIRKRLVEYRKVLPKQYFYELLYCLMTPQSSAVNAAKAQALFEALDFEHKEVNIESVLRTKEHYIRFHRSKARWIAKMKQQYENIYEIVSGNFSAIEKREWLVKYVLGLSYKEATHFLRNIGKNEGLTILDRHILTNLKYYGIIRTIPKSLTKKNYISIERKFQAFAEYVNITVDELDLLFWSSETGEILK